VPRLRLVRSERVIERWTLVTSTPLLTDTSGAAITLSVSMDNGQRWLQPDDDSSLFVMYDSSNLVTATLYPSVAVSPPCGPIDGSTQVMFSTPSSLPFPTASTNGVARWRSLASLPSCANDGSDWTGTCVSSTQTDSSRAAEWVVCDMKLGDSEKVYCVSPAGVAGEVVLDLSFDGGSSWPAAFSKLRYVFYPPAEIDDFNPKTGPRVGGTSITIT
jgi:hypothetical protein